MPQHINLLDASQPRRREMLGSTTGLVAVLATFGAAVALAMGLQSFSAKTQAQSVVLEQDLAALQARVAALGTPAPSGLVAPNSGLAVADRLHRRSGRPLA
jgi:hypothetical protein